ncbi:putative lipoprotein lppL [Mycobacterium xenopi 3993]|nr:putative lipoprotein lppL [Mycobacterium xenopi 3993]
MTAVGVDGNAEQALRAGLGATTVTADPVGRCWSPTPAAVSCWCSASTR